VVARNANEAVVGRGGVCVLLESGIRRSVVLVRLAVIWLKSP
jgi:hypothetical protein